MIQKGFTLIELLVVLAIIAILTLATMSFIKYNSYESENQAIKNTMDVMEQQVKSYKLLHGAYPMTIETQ